MLVRADVLYMPVSGNFWSLHWDKLLVLVSCVEGVCATEGLCAAHALHAEQSLLRPVLGWNLQLWVGGGSYGAPEKDIQMGGLTWPMASSAAGTVQRPSPAMSPEAATGMKASASWGFLRCQSSLITDPMHMSTCNIIRCVHACNSKWTRSYAALLAFTALQTYGKHLPCGA